MEPLYKVGDKVRIVEKIYPTTHYRCGFTDDMSKLSGRTFTIRSVREYSGKTKYDIPDDHYIYSLDEDIAKEYLWVSSMFEPVNTINVFGHGCIHLSKNNKVKLNFKL